MAWMWLLAGHLPAHLPGPESNMRDNLQPEPTDIDDNLFVGGSKQYFCSLVVKIRASLRFSFRHLLGRPLQVTAELIKYTIVFITHRAANAG
jgi:hypothetical protein